MRVPGPTREPTREQVRQRLLILGQLRALPAWMLSATVVLQLARALLPTATVLLSGALVGRLVAVTQHRGPTTGSSIVPVVGWFVAALLAGLLLELLIEPLRFVVTRRLDGAHRRAVERLACAPSGIAHLEDPRLQDDLMLAAGDPDNWTERTPGSAAWAQIGLVVRYVSSLLLIAVIATGSVPIACFLLAMLATFRAVQRRGFLSVIQNWVAGMPHRRRAAYWSGLVTGSAAAKELRVFGFWRWAQRHYRDEAAAHLDPFRAAKLADLRRQWQWLGIVVVSVGVAVYLLSGMAAGGRISIGRLSADLAALTLLVRAFGARGEMVDVEGGLPRRLALHRLSRQLTAAAGPRQSATLQAGTTDWAAPPRVRFEDVRFSYPGTSHAVLDGLGLEIRPAEVVALVGLNGAGKTTIMKLLAGLYLPDDGRITVDGADLRTLDMNTWRHGLAMVFQDFLQYPLSVRDNITLGAPDHATPENLRAAAEQSGLTELIDSLPAGWDTPLSASRAGGVNLSGGQWQCIALARAILAVHAGARLLVLDEPTAHLDVRTEAEVFRRVIEGMKGVASIVLISHRLSTVRKADRIILVENGRVSESGVHDDLMARQGSYARLFRLQASRFTGTVPAAAPTGQGHVS
jgi:ABC-type multidrug transport system fused ATPase/permease subunit